MLKKSGLFPICLLTQFTVVLFQYLVLLSLGHKLSLALCELLLDVKILLFYMKQEYGLNQSKINIWFHYIIFI